MHHELNQTHEINQILNLVKSVDNKILQALSTKPHLGKDPAQSYRPIVARSEFSVFLLALAKKKLKRCGFSLPSQELLLKNATINAKSNLKSQREILNNLKWLHC